MHSPWWLKVRFAAVTDAGNFRQVNEDSYLICRLGVEESDRDAGCLRLRSEDTGLLLLVADGVGGGVCGDFASRLGARTVAESLQRQVRTNDQLLDHRQCTRFLALAAREANQAILTSIEEDASRDGMATTLAAIWVMRNAAYRLHLGDSRIYSLYANRLQQVTRDHSPVEILVQARSITEEQARTHPFKNVVDQVLGLEEEKLQPEVEAIELVPGSQVLICSDGVSDALTPSDLQAMLQKRLAPQDKATRLVEWAKRAGSRDNITALVAQFGGW